MPYVGYYPYIDAVRAVLRRHQKRDPCPVAINQLDYDVGYVSQIKKLKEEVSARGWSLYKPNLRLALIALVAAGAVRPREHAAFDFLKQPEEPNVFETELQPDAFEQWHQFMNATVAGLPGWANEVVDLATTEIRGDLSKEDVFERIRAIMHRPGKSVLNAVVHSVLEGMRAAPSQAPMRQVQSGPVVALYGKTDLAEKWSNVPLFCLYDLEPSGAIGVDLAQRARSLALKAEAAPILLSNKLSATKAALLNASCGVPPVTLLGFGEVVATSDLQHAANDFTLAGIFGVI